MLQDIVRRVLLQEAASGHTTEQTEALRLYVLDALVHSSGEMLASSRAGASRSAPPRPSEVLRKLARDSDIREILNRDAAARDSIRKSQSYRRLVQEIGENPAMSGRGNAALKGLAAIFSAVNRRGSTPAKWPESAFVFQGKNSDFKLFTNDMQALLSASGAIPDDAPSVSNKRERERASTQSDRDSDVRDIRKAPTLFSSSMVSLYEKCEDIADREPEVKDLIDEILANIVSLAGVLAAEQQLPRTGGSTRSIKWGLSSLDIKHGMGDADLKRRNLATARRLGLADLDESFLVQDETGELPDLDALSGVSPGRPAPPATATGSIDVKQSGSEEIDDTAIEEEEEEEEPAPSPSQMLVQEAESLLEKLKDQITQRAEFLEENETIAALLSEIEDALVSVRRQLEVPA